ncbi:hypothetical protein ACNSPG_16170 [Brucella pituitosa]|uniref:hypothetical protein n=1 Tax=Brucella pituitosa TaxID=571256 RepID=UPI003C71DEBB
MTLIDRLSKLDGPDREVDAEIFCSFNGYVLREIMDVPFYGTMKFFNPTSRTDQYWSGEYGSEVGELWKRYPEDHHYTASVDAAIALAEKVLPGVDATIRTKHNVAWLDGFRGLVCEGATPAIALCIAILREKEDGKL